MRKPNELAKKRCGLCSPNGLIFWTTHCECNQSVGLLFMPLKLSDPVVVCFEKLQESGWHSDSFAV